MTINSLIRQPFQLWLDSGSEDINFTIILCIVNQCVCVCVCVCVRVRVGNKREPGYEVACNVIYTSHVLNHPSPSPSPPYTRIQAQVCQP